MGRRSLCFLPSPALHPGLHQPSVWGGVPRGWPQGRPCRVRGGGAGSARLRGGPPILTPNFRVMCGAGLVAEVTSEKVRQRPGRPPAWGVQGVDAALVRAERRATSRTSCHSETPARGAASRSPASPQHKTESDPRLCWAGSSGGWGRAPEPLHPDLPSLETDGAGLRKMGDGWTDEAAPRSTSGHAD